jgi:hypothetical protein
VKQRPSPEGSGTGEGTVAACEWALFPNTPTFWKFFETDLLSLDHREKIG